MKASIKLMTSKLKTKNGYPIVLEVSDKGKRLRRNIAFSEKIDWNNVENIPLKSHPLYRSLYAYILNLKSKIHEVSLMGLSIDSTMNFILKSNKSTTFVELRISELKKQGRLEG